MRLDSTGNKCQGNTYLQYNSGKRFASIFTKYDLNDFDKGTFEKKIRAGYTIDNIALGVQFDQKEQKSWSDMSGQLSVGFAYSGLKNTKIGLDNQINT